MNKWLSLLSLIIVVILAGLWRAGIIPAEAAFGIAVLLPGGDTLLRAMGLVKPPVRAAYLQVTAGQLGRLAVDFDQAAADAYTAYGAAAGWLTVGGSPMPSWGEQSPRLKALWVEAARGAHGEPPGVAPGSLAPPPSDPRRAELTVRVLDTKAITWLAEAAKRWSSDPALRKPAEELLQFLSELAKDKRPRTPEPPPVPPAPAALPRVAVLAALFLGALTACVAPARRNEARTTFVAAQQDQVAAAADLAALDREHQQDLALEIPRAGVTRVRAAVVAWRGRRADVLATSERLAREAAEARPTMEGSGDPAKLEELAQRAKEGAAQLRAAITGLRAYGAEQLRELAPQAAPADGGVR